MRKLRSEAKRIDLDLLPQGAFGNTMSMLRLIIGSTSILLVTNISFLTTGVKYSFRRVSTRRVMH